MLFTVIAEAAIKNGYDFLISQIESQSIDRVLHDWVQSDNFHKSGYKESDRKEFYEEEMFDIPCTAINNTKNAWRVGFRIDERYCGFTIFKSLGLKLTNSSSNDLRLYTYFSNIVDTNYVPQYKGKTAEAADALWLNDDYSWYTELDFAEFKKRKTEIWIPKMNFTPVESLIGVCRSKIYNEEAEDFCYRILTDQS